MNETGTSYLTDIYYNILSRHDIFTRLVRNM